MADNDGADLPLARELDDRQRVESGGWCAPSSCAAGICSDVAKHEADCPGPGWAYSAVRDARWAGEFLSLPKVQVKRGGIQWPWFVVETTVTPVTTGRFFKRTRWHLHIRYYDGERHMHHYMEFAKENLARNAEQIIKFTVQTVNEKHERESDAR